jgi:hypothetical protein
MHLLGRCTDYIYMLVGVRGMDEEESPSIERDGARIVCLEQ